MKKTTSSWGLVLSAVVMWSGLGCTSGQGPVLARPDTSAVKRNVARQALGGVSLSTTAQWNAPVLDANGTSAPQFGSGSYSVAPSSSGGPEALGAVDTSASPTLHYVIVGNLSGAPSAFFAVIADVPFTVGAHAIDNVHFFAGLFDAITGAPTHLATQGTVTFTAAGGVGGRLVGDFTGALEAVAAGCQTTADCAAGELCSNGTCVRPPPAQCLADSDCAAGQVCQAGLCVVTSAPTSCEGRQGTGAAQGQVGAVASCAALQAGAVTLSQGFAFVDDQLRLAVVDAAGTEGVTLELAVCPGALGTLTLGQGLVAASHVKDVQTADLRLFAERRASSAVVTVTSLSPSLAGDFSLTLATGGQVSGSFSVR